MAELQEGLSKQQHEALFEELERATTEVGNRIEAGGKPFTAEMYVDLCDRVELSFDSDGEWIPQTLVIHLSQTERIRIELRRLDEDPTVSARLKGIIERQRGEWRDREARRRLVD